MLAACSWPFFRKLAMAPSVWALTDLRTIEVVKAITKSPCEKGGWVPAGVIARLGGARTGVFLTKSACEARLANLSARQRFSPHFFFSRTGTAMLQRLMRPAGRW